MHHWSELLANLAIVAIVTSIWNFSTPTVERLSGCPRAIIFGAIMAAGLQASMSLPFRFTEGVMLDTRYVFLAISGFFGGPLAAILPLISAVVRRLVIGGVGISVGIPQIVTASALGIAFYYALGGNILRMVFVPVLALAVAFCGVAGFYVVMPMEQWGSLSWNITGPFALTLFSSTLIAAAALMQERRGREHAAQNAMFREVMEAFPDCLYAKDLSGRYIVANAAAVSAMGRDTVGEVMGSTSTSYILSGSVDAVLAAEHDVARLGAPKTLLVDTADFGHGERTFLAFKTPMHAADGTIVGVITHSKDVTEEHALRTQLASTQERLQQALESMADGLALFDPQGRLVFHNRRYVEQFPMIADVCLPGTSLRQIIRTAVDRGERAVFGEEEEQFLKEADVYLVEGEREFQLADGRWFVARTSACSDGCAMIVFTDVTGNREREDGLRALSARLAELADTDGLTGLANRRAFDRSLAEVTETANGTGRDAALLLLDVDRFKAFNDLYGHPAGDACLQKVAAVVRSIAEAVPGSLVCRYGGEEFSVLLPDTDEAEAERIGWEIVQAVYELDVRHNGSEKNRATVSIGLACLHPRAEGGRVALLANADAGLYAAKSAGRNCVRVGTTYDTGVELKQRSEIALVSNPAA
jgi:diguanylate cyclase (GGDEF)-like protein